MTTFYLSNPYKRYQWAVLLLDIVFSSAFILALAVVGISHESVLAFTVWVLAYVSCNYVFGAYSIERGQPKQLTAVMLSLGVSSGISLLAVTQPLAAGVVLLLATASFVSASVFRATARMALMMEPNRRLLFCISSDAGRKRAADLRTDTMRHFVNNVVDVRDISAEDFRSMAARAHMVVYEPSALMLEKIAGELVDLRPKGVKVLDLPNFYAALKGQVPVELCDKVWFLQNSRSSLGSSAYTRLRRFVDVAVSLALLMLFALPMAAIAAAIRWTSPGSVIFCQERLGRFGKPFTVYKFRTMREDAEKDGPCWAQKKDPRATHVGSFLRKTHLDELPQLFNVLKGEMTLVGPRPIREHFVRQLSEVIPHYEMRLLIKPGLTGWGQVLGPHGSTLDEVRLLLEMELYYIQNANLLLDFYVLLRTAKKMISRGGL